MAGLAVWGSKVAIVSHPDDCSKPEWGKPVATNCRDSREIMLAGSA
jgi:hypothetical protein